MRQQLCQITMQRLDYYVIRGLVVMLVLQGSSKRLSAPGLN